VADVQGPWRTSYPAALDEARQSGKPVVLDFFADWCPPCQVMKHDVWPDEAVRNKLLDGYIPVALNVDRPENRPVATRYQVEGIPTILIVDAEGRVLKQGNFMSRDSLLEFLTRKSP
jgi:thiol:disulfide interchange protein